MLVSHSEMLCGPSIFVQFAMHAMQALGCVGTLDMKDELRGTLNTTEPQASTIQQVWLDCAGLAGRFH